MIQEHIELSEESALCEKMLRAGRGPDRGLNQQNSNRKLVLVVSVTIPRWFFLRWPKECASIHLYFDALVCVPVQANPLAVRYGSGYTYRVKEDQHCEQIKELIESIPVRSNCATSLFVRECMAPLSSTVSISNISHAWTNLDRLHGGNT